MEFEQIRRGAIGELDCVLVECCAEGVWPDPNNDARLAGIQVSKLGKNYNVLIDFESLHEQTLARKCIRAAPDAMVTDTMNDLTFRVIAIFNRCSDIRRRVRLDREVALYRRIDSGKL